mgnify:CR=1 FL=1
MSHAAEMKRCSRCGKAKPYTPEFFYWGSGQDYRCKVCSRVRSREWKLKNKERAKASTKAWRGRNRDRYLLSVKTWKARNMERNLELKRLSWNRHKDEINARKRARYHSDFEYRRKHIEEVRAWERRRREWSPQVLERRRVTERIKSARRRERMVVGGGVSTPCSAEVIRRLWWFQDGKCYYCQSKLVVYQVDHMTPIVGGGQTVPQNLCLSCSSCNRRKSDMTVEDFLLAVGA